MSDIFQFFKDMIPKNSAELNDISTWGISPFNLGWFTGGADYLRDRVHGGARAFMDSLPITGRIRNYRNDLKRAEDRWQNTGMDEAYSSPYARSIPFVNDAVGSFVKPARMANTLMKMYGAEVALDITKERQELYKNMRDAYRSSANAGRVWGEAWRNKR